MKANEAGVNIMINTDAHNIAMLEHMEVGVTAARKGWTPKANVVNTFTLNEIKKFLTRDR